MEEITETSGLDPKIPHKEVQVWEPWEVQRILSQAKIEPLEAVYVLTLSTGARGGEILALQPQDYDRRAGTLAIRRTLVKNGAEIGSPKSRNSNRVIALPQIAQDALARNTIANDRWLFPGKTGNNLRYHSFIRFQWRPMLERAGVNYRNFHVCRHWAISSMIKAGVPITSIARYAGDTEATILKTYSHLLNGMEHMVPMAMDEALG